MRCYYICSILAKQMADEARVKPIEVGHWGVSVLISIQPPFVSPLHSFLPPIVFRELRHFESKGRFTLCWRSPSVMNSRGILTFDWPRATILSGGGLHYGQESIDEEHWTWMEE